MRFLLLVFGCLLFGGHAAAQNCDTSRTRPLTDQSHAALKTDIGQAHRFALQAYATVRDCPGSYAYDEAVLSLCRVYHQMDFNDSALAVAGVALRSLPANASVRYRAALNHELSVASIGLMKLEDGVKYGLEALHGYEQLKDSVNITNMLVNISNAYQQQNNFNQANKYLRQAEAIALGLRNKTGLGHVYNTMGILYAEHSQLDSAEKFFLRSTGIREALNDRTSVVWNYNNLGGLYVMMEQPQKAIDYLEKALRLFKENNNVYGQSAVSTNLGELYLRLKNYPRALAYYTYARGLFKDTKDLDNMENLYTGLSQYYKLTGKPAIALQYADSLIHLKDSLYGNRLDERMAEMQTKFEVAKKDLEIEKHKADLELKEKQSFIKNVIIASVVALMLFMALLGYLYVRKKQVEQKAALAAEIAHQKEARTKAVIEAEENERRRIAQDLHDGVGQLLSAAKLNLSSLGSKLGPASLDQQDALKTALDLVDDSVKEVRTVSHNMMPNTLIKLGLASAVREFIGKLGNVPSLKIDLEIVGLDSRLEPQVETVLYRVIQELVSNILKHAKASHISMQLVRHDTEISLMIEDNGVGFDASRLQQFEGIGLKGILSRVEFLGGSVHFDSAPGRGTTAIVEVPL